MYCSSCGAEVSEGMSYCNRCGAKLKAGSEELAAVVSPSQPMVRGVAGAAWAMAAAVALITVVGFGMAFSLVMAFVTRGLSLDEGRLAVVMMALVSVVLIDWLLLRQFSRLMSAKVQAAEDKPARPEKRRPAEKPSIVPPQLAAPREPVGSVTEHTTRTFDTVSRERERKP